MPAEPRYIYKILPPGQPPPAPLPPALPVSDLDRRDGYIHASTSKQLLGTLNRFFSDATHVYLLRIPLDKVEAVVRWETTAGEAGQAGDPTRFPHLYNGLVVGREQVQDVAPWRLDGGEPSQDSSKKWTAAGWPFGDEDVPV